MDEIKINTQQELDNVDADFNGLIYILGKNIIVSRKYLCRVVAWENSSVEAWRNSSVEAWENSSVVARGNSSVVARGNSSVEAWENSSVVAWENSSVVARGNSSVEAWENSSVVARGNSSVEAWENSSVFLKGFSQAAIFSNLVKVQKSGMGRYIKVNENMKNFSIYHSLEIIGKNIVMYKAIRNNLSAFYDPSFKYVIGKKISHDCDPNKNEDCGIGLHVSSLDWAIRFGKEKKEFEILECLVPLNKIVLPINSNGKVRTSVLTVKRIVPKEEYENERKNGNQ